MPTPNEDNQNAGTPSPAQPDSGAAPAASATPAADNSASGDDGQNGGSDDSWITPDVRQAMDFDPFTPEADEPKPATTNPDGSPSADGGTPAQPASVTQAQDQNGGTPQGQGQPAQGQPQAQPAPVTYTQEQVNQILHAVRTGQGTQPQAGGQANPQGDAQPPQDPLAVVPEYNYNIPDALVTAMNSEDPGERKQAMAHLIKGVAVGIHQTIAAAVTQRLTQLEQGIPDAIQNRMLYAQQAQQVMTDFYGKFPQLNTPELRQIVQTVAKAHMDATGQQQWTEKLRDEVGSLVIQKLTGVIPAQAPAQAAPVQAPPAMFGGNAASGNSRAASPGPKTQADHMADIFDI